MDSDTITQRMQWIGLTPPSNHHPWFDTMVFGLFWNLGDAIGSPNAGLFTYLLLQEVALAIGLSLGFVYLRRLGASRLVMWTLVVLAAVFPVFMSSAAVVSKDSLAVVFWLPALVLFIEVARTRGTVLRNAWVCWSGAAILTALIMTKKTNGYVVLLCVVIVAFVVTAAIRRRMLLGVAVVIGVTSFVWPSLVVPALGVSAGTSTDMMTIPVQQTARVAAEFGADIPSNERDAIDRMLRWEGLGDAYVPGRSDSVKGRWDDAAPLSDKLAYAQAWLAQGLRYPGTYISATAANTYEYFAPLTPVVFQLSLTLDRYVPFWESRAYEEVTIADIEAATTDVLFEPSMLDTTRSVMNDLYREFANATPLMSKAFYSSWVPLFVLTYALRRRSALHVLATTPALVSLAVLVASPVALPRYMLPSIMSAMFLIGLCLLPVSLAPRIKNRSPRRSAIRRRPAADQSSPPPLR
ncbi:DUF6020 family protein [Microbacterium aquimaris]|uniref:DUF6020 family protein n=1 Tax=Microbacterium aquimaris TaxID=459816 RepID=A0ABU5N672_9MICO|nr:DUF6020 family protein [Microbacterium aquimaris]MDZ8161541.1 DUF6020 family protein [Microbacterium aquimaris]